MNAPAPTLSRMGFTYQLDGQDPEHVEVHNRSLIAWDETRGKRKWPSAQEAPFLWQTFIVWHHLSRTGQYPRDWSSFQDECVALEPDDDEVQVDPTQPAATPDWSSQSD